MIARQAVTDGFHFSDDVLDSLHSFPLELVSRLRRRTSPCGSELEPLPATDGHHSAETSVEDVLPDSSQCDRSCDVSCTLDEPMEDCTASVITASNTESVDMADCSMVMSLLTLFSLLFSVCL